MMNKSKLIKQIPVKTSKLFKIENSNKKNQILEIKLRNLSNLFQELIFYLIVYTIITLIVNLSLFYLVLKENWTLIKISIYQFLTVFQNIVFNYRRLFDNYFNKLRLILYSTRLDEIEDLNFSLNLN